MIHIQAGSRLHFGLLALPEGDPPRAFWPNHEGHELVPARWFGGAGLMVEEPGMAVSVGLAPSWSAAGPSGRRALEVAHRFADALPHVAKPCAIEVRGRAPEHVGLGSGTQLGLAVARALNLVWGVRQLDATTLAASVGRGLRSALGVHGFEHGGFLVEGGKRDRTAIGPLLTRLPFPENWPIILAIPRDQPGRHGRHETHLFEQLQQASSSLPISEALCRLVILGLLPALVERDYPTFAEALFDFNARSGELFAAVQGGLYSHPRTAALVRWLRDQGVPAAGQSSWGPTVFGIAEDEDKAASAADALRNHFNFAADEVVVTRARNEGARVAVE